MKIGSWFSPLLGHYKFKWEKVVTTAVQKALLWVSEATLKHTALYWNGEMLKEVKLQACLALPGQSRGLKTKVLQHIFWLNFSSPLSTHFTKHHAYFNLKHAQWSKIKSSKGTWKRVSILILRNHTNNIWIHWAYTQTLRLSGRALKWCEIKGLVMKGRAL